MKAFICIVACACVLGTVSTVIAYNVGKGPRDMTAAHQHIIQLALDKITPHHKAYEYFPIIMAEDFRDQLISGVWRADHSGLKCDWKFTDPLDCISIHHYWKLEKIESELDADVAHPGGFSAPGYAAQLFKQALAFWPSPNHPGPKLSSLLVMRAGSARITGWSSNLLFGSTHVGGEPFCGFRAKEKGIAYQDYCPRWPSFFAAEIGNPRTEAPKRSIAVSLQYLGWTLHMIQDLTVPYHVWHEATQDHADYENSIDKLIAQGQMQLHNLQTDVPELQKLTADGHGFDDIKQFVYQVGQYTKDYCDSHDCETTAAKKHLVGRAVANTMLLIEKFFRLVSVSDALDPQSPLALEDQNSSKYFYCNTPRDRDQFSVTLAAGQSAKITFAATEDLGQVFYNWCCALGFDYREQQVDPSTKILFLRNTGTTSNQIDIDLDCDYKAAGEYSIKLEKALKTPRLKASESVSIDDCNGSQSQITLKNEGTENLLISSLTLQYRSAGSRYIHFGDQQSKLAPAQPIEIAPNQTYRAPLFYDWDFSGKENLPFGARPDARVIVQSNDATSPSTEISVWVKHCDPRIRECNTDSGCGYGEICVFCPIALGAPGTDIEKCKKYETYCAPAE